MEYCGAFLHNGYHLYPGHLNYMERLGACLENLGVRMDKIPSTDLLYLLNEKGEIKTKDLPYDFIVVVDKDKYILKALESSGIKLFNSAKSVELCDDKLLTFFALSNQGIPMPKTMGIPLNYVNGDASAFLEKAGEKLGYPIVIKTNFGSMGTGVYLASSFDELKEVEAKLRPSSTLLQEFIPSSKGHDTRVILIGNKVVAAYKRVSDNGDFRSNIALGGHGERITLAEQTKDLCEKVSRILKLDYCGIDVLDGPNGPLICEVNSNAFFAEAEKVTGIDIAATYAKYIVSKL